MDIGKSPDIAAEKRIYFDNSATTPLDPRVKQAMLPYYEATFGNPSSLHWAGQEARQAVDHARTQVASLLNAEVDGIVFTASGTESDNMALIGVADALAFRDVHIVVSAFEHPAILETCRYLERCGVAVSHLPVGNDGIVDPEELRLLLRPSTCLVSVLTAHNVIGTIQPINELAAITHQHGALFHTDAVQAVGKVPFDMKRQPIDLLSLSAHKLYGPKGVGALYIRQGVRLEALVHGGGQENGRRSATENVAGIVGLGMAAELCKAEMVEEAARLVGLRDQLFSAISERIPNTYLIGHRYKRLPGHLCLGFAGQEGEAIKLTLALNEAGIAVSSGSACSAKHGTAPSYVLTAMGFDAFRARGSLRVTLGRFSTPAEVEYFLDVLPRAVNELRAISTHHTK